MPKTSVSKPVICFDDGTGLPDKADLILESPLLIRIGNKLCLKVMRTPGDETSQAAGFCLTEGLVESPENIIGIDIGRKNGLDVVKVRLSADRQAVAARLIGRKETGADSFKETRRTIRPLERRIRTTETKIRAAVSLLASRQMLYKKTRGTHAALIIDGRGRALAMAEDVGRHNVLDKVIGRVFLNNQIKSTAMAVISSRLNYELVLKAARAGLEVMIGISRPTGPAVEMAVSTNMTLACDQDGRLLGFSGHERLVPD